MIRRISSDYAEIDESKSLLELNFAILQVAVSVLKAIQKETAAKKSANLDELPESAAETDAQPYMCTKTFGERCRCDSKRVLRTTVEKWCYYGRINAIKVGTEWRIPPSEINRYRKDKLLPIDVTRNVRK